MSLSRVFTGGGTRGPLWLRVSPGPGLDSSVSGTHRTSVLSGTRTYWRPGDPPDRLTHSHCYPQVLLCARTSVSPSDIYFCGYAGEASR